MAASPQTANDLMVVFSNTVSAGFDALSGAVNGVFGIMIGIVVALTGVQWALSSNREVLASGFGKVLLIGAFAYLINDWQGLSQTIFAGFIELGLTAGGGSLSRADFLNPGAILQQGWEIVKALGDTPAFGENALDVVGALTDALILGLAMIGIMLAFAILALQIIVTLLEFKIVTLGGFVLLPFGIWSKSSFLAERPLGFVVSSGLKTLALAIVVSGARSVFDQLQPSGNPDLYEALAILAASLLLAMLALFIPNLASALVTGGPALGAGAAISSGIAVAAGGALTVAGTVGLGAAAARIAGSSRAAAGAGTGRAAAPSGAPPRSPPPASPPVSPSPSNDNPPRGSGPTGGLAGRGPGVGEAGRAWPAPPAGAAAEPEADHGPDGPGPASPQTSPAPARDPRRITGETEAARRDFHRAAAAAGTADASASPRQRRNAALQTFFLANAGRGLLPAGETSGTISPQLKSEEP